VITKPVGSGEVQNTSPLKGKPVRATTMAAILGVLSLSTNVSKVFAAEHLRLAKLLSIPAAVAIQNARMYERAEIYAAELEDRLRELQETRRALKHTDH